jgi:alpha-galactosidase
MKKLSFFIVFCLPILMYSIYAQSYAKSDEKSLILDNGVIRRVINIGLQHEGIISNSLKLVDEDQEFLIPGSEEFSFIVNGKRLTGTSQWKTISVSGFSSDYEGDGALVILEFPDKSLRIGVTYQLYSGLPVIRKKISFTNNGQNEIKLESLDIECLRLSGSETDTECWVMNDCARQKSLGQFISTAYDPLVVVHQTNLHRGIALGNEAPGVMKRTTTFLEHNLLTIGLTHQDQNFAFREWIKSGETWESTWVFSAIYSKTNAPNLIINGPINDFVRNHMGTRLSKMKEKPVFVYNTWEPFWHNINEKMIFEIVDAAAECGIEEFIIDDGWQESYGDWGVNKEKFPNGLKPIFDYIKLKGMKPGVWISLAAAESKSNVYKEHSEWLVRKADNSPINLHADEDKMYEWETYSMCMTTGWKDNIKKIILEMVQVYGSEYIKADFAAVTGSYTTDKTRSGCHAKNHNRKDRNESLLEMYQATWQLFDELHQEAPNLFIDCTFETMGALQLIDYDMCKYADGNWLSNFNENAPVGALKVRQMGWWRSPVIQATSMVIGNQRLDDPDFYLSLKSLAGTLPIVLGDPRLLTPTQRAQIKVWANWLQEMQTKHDFMDFRQDLSGFGEPAEGFWDGFQRINSETKSGGIVGVFRQGAKEERRMVTVQFLGEKAVYNNKSAPDGKLMGKMNGKELSDKGFEVVLGKTYDGTLFEIVKS